MVDLPFMGSPELVKRKVVTFFRASDVAICAEATCDAVFDYTEGTVCPGCGGGDYLLLAKITARKRKEIQANADEDGNPPGDATDRRALAGDEGPKPPAE